MELFIDSADIKTIKKINKLSIFKGITTTPTFFYKQGIYEYEDTIKEIQERVVKEYERIKEKAR